MDYRSNDRTPQTTCDDWRGAWDELLIRATDRRPVRDAGLDAAIPRGVGCSRSVPRRGKKRFIADLRGAGDWRLARRVASPEFQAPTVLASGGCVPSGLASWRSPLRVDCAALLGAGARARTRCAPAALRSDSWRESVDEARCARRPRPCGARRHSTPAPTGRSHRSLDTAWQGPEEKSRLESGLSCSPVRPYRPCASSPLRLGQISRQIVKRVLASSGHRGRDDARGQR